jgi:MerR family mercuric resistance operon transcriptional regulator
MPHTLYTIGKLAQAADLNVETIRYYQRIGLIEEPARPPSGYRRYSEETLERLRFIVRAKQLGFTLAETRDFLELDNNDFLARQQMAQNKLALIQEKIADLQAISETLEQVIATCTSPADTCTCPLSITRAWMPHKPIT